MKRTLYLLPLLLCLALLVQAQSQINSTVQVHPGGNMGVYGNLNFNSGYVITPRTAPANNVYATAGATHTGASDGSHVNGYVEEAGHAAFTFPIGNGTTYRSAGIASASTAVNYRAAYFSGNPGSATLPSGAPFATTSRGTGVGAVSAVEYWDIDGSASASITLSWNAASNVNTLAGGSLNRLVIVGWNGSQWVNLGQAGGVSGTPAGTGSVTATNVTPNTYTAYTFGSLECQLAATATATSATICSGGTISLSASTTGAVGALSYNWSGPNNYAATGSSVNIPNATVAATGAYTVVVTDAGTGCSATAVTGVTVNECRISLRVYLQGALLGASSGTGANGLPLMRDNIRSGGYLPLNDPYRVAPYTSAFTHVNNAESQTIPASMTLTTGDKAIVDWVFVELRNKTTPTQVSYTRSALLLRDGSVLDSDGQGGVNFANVPIDNYYVAVRHRNHMGIMIDQTVTVPSSTTVDFNTLTDTQIWNNTGYDALERSTTRGVRALWAGNANPNDRLRYVGTAADPAAILANLLNDPGYSGSFNFTNARGYLSGDVNLDGRVLYVGTNSDPAVVLGNVVNYPLNSTKAYNYALLLQQLP